MARGGIFGRIGRAISRVLPGRPAPPPRQPPPREPPERIPPGEYRDIWRHEKTTGKYRKHLALFNRMMDDIHETDPDERLALWESYVHNIVGETRERRQSTSNMFWRDSGIDPQNFDWQAWREAMGYVGKRRSRTP